jgi:type IV pilus assembly protein PilC
MLWQTMSYPVIVLLIFFGMLYLILVELIPKWEPLLAGFSGMKFWVKTGGTYSTREMQMPIFTRALFEVSNLVASWPGGILLAVIAAAAVGAWALLRIADGDGGFAERFWLHMPLVGTVVRRNLISRWCHATALAVEAGMDLSAAIKLADDATASPVLRADGASLISALAAGQPLSASSAGKILPATVVTAMDTSAGRGDLAITLRALSQMYQQQAELRIGAVQSILTPVLLLIVGVVVGGLMIAMFAPLLTVLNML